MHDSQNKEANLHFIFSPIGSAGDVHPMLSVALELQRRGHEITFVVNGYFRELVVGHGLRHVQLGSREEFLAGANHPDLWNPMRAFRHIYRSIVEPCLRTQYMAFAERYLPGQTVGIVNCFGFGGLLAQEKTGLPVLTIHLSPAVLWSDIEPPVLTGAAGPLWLRRLGFRLGERLVIDRTVCPGLNRLRRELGLQPIRAIVRGWHSPRCSLPPSSRNRVGRLPSAARLIEEDSSRPTRWRMSHQHHAPVAPSLQDKPLSSPITSRRTDFQSVSFTSRRTDLQSVLQPPHPIPYFTPGCRVPCLTLKP